MTDLRTSRRRFLKIAASAGVASSTLGTTERLLAGPAADASAVAASLADGRILIEFDSNMRSRVWDLSPTAEGPSGGSGGTKVALTHWAASDSLDVLKARESVSVAKAARLDTFVLGEQSKQAIDGPLGRGTRLKMTGATGQIEKTLEIELLKDFPGFALYQVMFRNLGTQAVTVSGWTQCALQLSHRGRGGRTGDGAGAGRGANTASDEPPFWSFCGSTHEDRRDWVQPVRPGFDQQNFMGMSASDYGGGTPVVDVWRRSGGVAIGHLEVTPRLVSLPVTCAESTLNVAMTAQIKHVLQPGEQITLPRAFIATHSGDYFAVLDAYRRIMAVRGIASPPPPKAAYEPVWCAWGYERDCTLQLIEDTLPKVRDLQLRWAVIDDGWQSNVGDWKVHPAKYPGGEADMRRLVQKIRSNDLEARLWWAPLAVAPGSDLLHDHTDLLLLDKEGAVQNVSWWNCFYLCPGYQPTVDYMVGLVRKFIGDWGYAGLKIDGQHLNAVAPCYNPAHKHARPEESVEKLQDFFQAVYQAALAANPQAVVELCPCGTSYSFFNFRSFNQAPASDPESSWQVRHKGKTLKALMGPSAAFAGDHVELSTGGADFASTVGVGGIISTKFTWPHDPKPKDSFLLTPEKETVWRKWIALYNERQLPQGTYRGELYDIGFDKPETHVVEKDGRFYYAFYGRDFSGPVALRGLRSGQYRVRDYYNERELGQVSALKNTVPVSFNNFLVLEAIPV